jgi:hypothetical protein
MLFHYFADIEYGLIVGRITHAVFGVSPMSSEASRAEHARA